MKVLSKRFGNQNSLKHGFARRNGKTLEYRIWIALRTRCNNPKSTAYRLWGGRGIKVCERWNSFRNFLEDMGPIPTPQHTIDRFPNNDGDYEPGNCRWATRAEQNGNRRNNRILELNGVKKTGAQWARDLGITQATLNERIEKWGVEKALATPKYQNRYW